MDDGSSEAGKVREDECVDIYDDGEVNEERTSAPVAEKDNDFVGQKLGKYSLLLGEYKGKEHRNECGYRCMGVENIGLTGGPEKYQVRTLKQDQDLEDQVELR